MLWISEKHLSWLDTTPLVLPVYSDHSYTENNEVILQHIKIHKLLMLNIRNNGPYQFHMHALVPKDVADWNRFKDGVDNADQVLSKMKSNHKKCGPKIRIVLRLFWYIIYNICTKQDVY